jgi:hypothetical protein
VPLRLVGSEMCIRDRGYSGFVYAGPFWARAINKFLTR